MASLVERLRECERTHTLPDCGNWSILGRAADRIETLEAWAEGPNGVRWYTDRYAEQQASIELLVEALEAVDEMFSRPGALNKNTIRDKVRSALSQVRETTPDKRNGE